MPTATTSAAKRMLSVKDVSERLNCSERHIYELFSSGRMPRPRKIGRLARWLESELDQWINDGCPRVERQRRA